jgi:hypothetical protein
MSATGSVAAKEGKKTDDRTVTSSRDAYPTTVADAADPQTLMLVTTTSVSDILLKTNADN